MKILVGSVFIDDSKIQEKWLDIQLRYLRATTKNFKHVSFLSNVETLTSDFFKKNTTWVKNTKSTSMILSEAHVNGLEALLKYFKDHRDQYDRFLFIDSDAFPIRKDWVTCLESKMQERHIAIPVRSENLERRLHSSILYAKPEALDLLGWDVTQVGLDLVGNLEKDVCLKAYQNKPEKVYTMVRSNRFNYHPLLCAVYYDIFYHHGCGSGRVFNMRAREYWDHAFDINVNVEEFTDKLMRFPNNFINKAAGWKSNMYGEV